MVSWGIELTFISPFVFGRLLSILLATGFVPALIVVMVMVAITSPRDAFCSLPLSTFFFQFEARAFQGPYDEEPVWKVYKVRML